MSMYCAGVVPFEERALYGDSGEQGGRDVADACAGANRPPARLARDAQHAAHALNDNVERRAVRVGAALPETGH